MIRFILTMAMLFPALPSATAGVAPPVPSLPGFQPAPADVPDKKTGSDEEDAAALDPKALVDRIAENTRKADQKLGEFDTGAETLRTQEQILRDLDKLLNPPPMPNNNNNNNNSNSGESNPPPPSEGSNSSKPSPSNPPPQPMNGATGPSESQPSPSGGSRSNREARQQQRERERQQAKANPGDNPMSQLKSQPMPQPTGDEAGKASPGVAKGTMPSKPTGSGLTASQGGTGTPSLPLDETITKEVWGHLPERLRQQMNQYYQEQFMPRYSNLLREYYSALAAKEQAPKK